LENKKENENEKKKTEKGEKNHEYIIPENERKYSNPFQKGVLEKSRGINGKQQERFRKTKQETTAKKDTDIEQNVIMI